jgi:hypothetical protein
MSIQENMQKHFCQPVYPAMQDSSSELYKFMLAISNELEDYSLSLVEFKNALSVNTATGLELELVGDSYNIPKYKGELDSAYRRRFSAMTGLADISIYGLQTISDLFTALPALITEKGSSEIDIELPQGATVSPEYIFCVGVQGDYGSGIGDEDEDTAGAVYSSIDSVVTVSRTYYDFVMNKVKPAGIKLNIYEEGEV